MGGIVKSIVDLLSGGAGAAVGGFAVNVAALGALVAGATPVVIALEHHKDEVFIAITYGQLAFFGSCFGVFVFALLKLAHYTRPPQ